MYDDGMTTTRRTIEVGNVVKWGSSKQWHYGVVIEVDDDRIRVEYTHSTPLSTVAAGRNMDLHLSSHKELRVV